MREQGRAEIAAAEVDGRWRAVYASQRAATVSAYLVAALDANPTGRRVYERLGTSDAYRIVLPLPLARTEKVRAGRPAGDQGAHRGGLT